MDCYNRKQAYVNQRQNIGPLCHIRKCVGKVECGGGDCIVKVGHFVMEQNDIMLANAVKVNIIGDVILG